MKQEHGDNQESSGQVFLVRLWPAEGSAGAQWHGKVQNIVHGEASSFAELPALIDCLLTLLPGQKGGHEPAEAETTNEEPGRRAQV
jgi:hypothetical protein